MNQQNPEYLWIGCSDSRVPANEIVGLNPGELFVHRNVANLVLQTDINCMSVVQYAVEVLGVKHIIVCGHYGCGGVRTAMGDENNGLIDAWLLNIKNTHEKHQAILDNIHGEKEKENLLCELNVIEQVKTLSRSTIIKQAWARGQKVDIHGWVYSLHNGLLKDLEMTVSTP